jgi:hypothetical protein
MRITISGIGNGIMCPFRLMAQNFRMSAIVCLSGVTAIAANRLTNEYNFKYSNETIIALTTIAFCVLYKLHRDFEAICLKTRIKRLENGQVISDKAYDCLSQRLYASQRRDLTHEAVNHVLLLLQSSSEPLIIAEKFVVELKQQGITTEILQQICQADSSYEERIERFLIILKPEYRSLVQIPPKIEITGPRD